MGQVPARAAAAFALTAATAALSWPTPPVAPLTFALAVEAVRLLGRGSGPVGVLLPDP